MSTTVYSDLRCLNKIGGQWIIWGASNFSNLLGQWLQELNVEGWTDKCHDRQCMVQGRHLNTKIQL